MKKFFLLIIIIVMIFGACDPAETPPGDGGDGGGGETVTPDTSAPVITIVNPSDSSAVSSSLVFSGIAEDDSDIAQVQVQIDSNGWITLSSPSVYWSYTVNTFLLTEGAHTASVKATDAKGNASAPSTVNFTVDQTVPSISITSPSHGDTIKGTVTIEGTASDASGISSVLINPDEGSSYQDTGDTTSWNYDFDSSTVSDGTRIISILAYDSAGLYTIENFAVQVDNTAPTIVIESHSDQETIDSAFTLSGTASDSLELKRVEIKVDSNPNGLATGTSDWSYDISGLTEEAHTIQVIAYDGAGNFTNESITIYYDETPPAITINNPAANSYNTGTITIDGIVNNLDPSGSDTLEISINGAAYTAITSYAFVGPHYSWDYDYDSTALSGQPITVNIRAVDAVTNAEDIAAVNFNVDNTAPLGTLESPSEGASVTTSGTVQITGTASDNMAVDSITIDISDDQAIPTTLIGETATYADGYWAYNWSTTGFLGTSTISVTITDKVGKTLNLTPVNVTMSASAPTGVLTSPTNGDIVKDTVLIDITASSVAGIDTVTVQVDSDTPAAATDDLDGTYSYSLDTNSLSEGSHNLTITITDLSSAVTSLLSNIIVDNTDPVVAITYPTASNTGDNFLYSLVNASGTASDIHLDTVEIEIDSQGAVAVTGTTSWTYAWNTVSYPGAKNNTVITVTATDSVGNTGTASVTVDVRPKIDSISLSSGIRGESLEIYGYNFNDSLANFNMVFTEGVGTVNGSSPLVGTAGPTGESITITIPASATSGDIYVEEGNPIIQSNALHLDVWENTTLTDAEEMSMIVTATDVYAGLFNKPNFDFYNGSANVVDTGGQRAGAGVSIVMDDTDTNIIYAVYMDKNGGSIKPKLSKITLSPYAASVYDITIGGSAITSLSESSAMSLDFYKGTLHPDASDDVLAMIYYDTSDSRLKYTYTDTASPTTWESAVTVDSTSLNGTFSKLAFDSTGTAYVVYYDNTNKNLKFGYFSGVFFVTTTVDSSTFVGEYCSMTLDSSDGIHISYYDGNNGDLRYAYAADKDSSFTITEGVASSGITGQYSDIAVDSSGNPHIAFLNYNLSTIDYVYHDGSQWINVAAPDSLTTALLTRLSVETLVDDVYIGYVDTNSVANYLVYFP